MSRGSNLFSCIFFIDLILNIKKNYYDSFLDLGEKMEKEKYVRQGMISFFRNEAYHHGKLI